jgi:hypothetical protein
MKRRYFNTKEAAERHLEVRRKAAYKRIEKKGRKVVSDRSRVYTDYLWEHKQLPFGETAIGKLFKDCDPNYECKDLICEGTQTNKLRWFIMLLIVTDEMIKDLTNFRSMDYEAELEAIIKEAQTIDKNIVKDIAKKAMDSSSCPY